MAASDVSAPLTNLLDGRGLLIVGCGKMGGAVLEGWLAAGVRGAEIEVVEPAPSERLSALAAREGVALRASAAQAAALSGGAAPAMALIAVKPQMMSGALPALATLGSGETGVLSVAAGTPIAAFAAAFGAETPIVRAMPNTPAAIGRGVSALVANAAARGGPPAALAEALMACVGDVVWLDSEDDIDAVTAVSGAGPAYVFHMIEALAAAAEAEGLAPALAMRLARATVSGAGALAAAAPESAAELRRNVTSPNGVTAAGLEELMREAEGLSALMRRTVAAAAARSRELRG